MRDVFILFLPNFYAISIHIRVALKKMLHKRIPGDDPSVGVWLRNTDTGDETQLPAVNIVLNEPSRLLLLIPAELAQGEYELRVVTQMTSGGWTLKEPRSATLATPVKAD